MTEATAHQIRILSHDEADFCQKAPLVMQGHSYALLMAKEIEANLPEENYVEIVPGRVLEMTLELAYTGWEPDDEDDEEAYKEFDRLNEVTGTYNIRVFGSDAVGFSHDAITDWAIKRFKLEDDFSDFVMITRWKPDPQPTEVISELVDISGEGPSATPTMGR